MHAALPGAVAAALERLCHAIGDLPIVRLSLDCHPWNGTIELALLTLEEARQHPDLLDPSEMAAWRHFAFTAADTKWRETIADLEAEMAVAYGATDDRDAIVRYYLELCAAALRSPEVSIVLSRFVRAEDFAFSVTHPDTDEEFVRP